VNPEKNPAASEANKSPGAGGCFLLLLGIVVFECGIVLTAVALHWMLSSPGAAVPTIAGIVVAGVLLTFAAPRIFMLAGKGRPQITWTQAACALPDLLVAGWFLLGWAAPHVIGSQAAGLLVGVVVLEFIIIHASVGLVAFPPMLAEGAPAEAWWRTRAALTIGLLLFYSLFAAGFSAVFSSWWLFIGFWILFLNKYLSDWLQPAAQAEVRRREHLARWGTSAGLYFVLAMQSIFLPMPHLSATSASRGDGLWERHPEQAVAIGAMYFAALGFCELYGGFRSAAAKPEA
jgi:hypothetical protein